MQLIIYYKVSDVVDEISSVDYSYEEHIPALYRSTESLHDDFIDACEKAFSENKDEFSIGGMTFSVDSFIYRNYKKKNTYIRNWPEIMTIDEWSEKSEKNKDLLMENIK